MSTLPVGFTDVLGKKHGSTITWNDRRVTTDTTYLFDRGRVVGSVRFTKYNEGGYDIEILNDMVSGSTQWAGFSCRYSDGGFSFKVTDQATATDPDVATSISVSPAGISGHSLVRVDLTNTSTTSRDATIILDESIYSIVDFPTLVRGAWCEMVDHARACTVPSIDPGSTQTIVALVAAPPSAPGSTIISVGSQSVAKFRWGSAATSINHQIADISSFKVTMK